jgi:hypothetical protein
MKPRSLFAQTAHTLGSLAGNQGLQIAAGIAISRVYGPPGKGLVTYAGIAMLGAIAIADGLISAIARQCANEDANVPATYAAAVRIILLVSLVVAVPLALLGAFVPAQRALLFVGFSFPFALYVQTMSGFHLVTLRVERTNVASLVVNAGAALAMLIAILLARPSINVIMAIWTAGYVAGAAIIRGGLGHGRADPDRKRSAYSALMRFAIRSSSASLMTFLASRIDVFIIAATLSATALGNYTLALAVGELMWQLARAMSWSAFGRVATAPFAQGACNRSGRRRSCLHRRTNRPHLRLRTRIRKFRRGLARSSSRDDAVRGRFNFDLLYRCESRAPGDYPTGRKRNALVVRPRVACHSWSVWNAWTGSSDDFGVSRVVFSQVGAFHPLDRHPFRSSVLHSLIGSTAARGDRRTTRASSCMRFPRC